LTARVNYRPGSRLLNVEDFNPQETVRVNLRGVRHHGGNNFAFRLDGFVALKADEVGDGLAGLQFGNEMYATVTGANSSSG